MMPFRLLLIVLLATLLIYTPIVIAEHGMGLFQQFFGDIAQITWPGQFNLDFFGFLILSATWTLWRNGFSLLGWVLAPIALTGGIPFLTTYLLVLSFTTNGDYRRMLLGVNA